MQKSLRDVSRALEEAAEALAEIERRALYENPPELTFPQRVIRAARNVSNGEPLKDFLSREEVERAVMILADVYTATGVEMPADWH